MMNGRGFQTLEPVVGRDGALFQAASAVGRDGSLAELGRSPCQADAEVDLAPSPAGVSSPWS